MGVSRALGGAAADPTAARPAQPCRGHSGAGSGTEPQKWRGQICPSAVRGGSAWEKVDQENNLLMSMVMGFIKGKEGVK